MCLAFQADTTFHVIFEGEVTMKYTVGLLAALTLSFSVCVSNAATITFDDAVGGGNPAGTYTEAGYLFTPNSATNDVKC